jgi:hypothetical protein
VNYVLVGQPLDAAVMSGEWTEVALRLTDDPTQWACLGAREETADRYGCAPLAEVLADVNRDFGFILFPIGPSARPPTGRIAIDEFRIQYHVGPRTPIRLDLPLAAQR